MKLSEFLRKYPHFAKYYDVLKDYLPSADEIEVYTLDELERFGFKARETVLACALKPNKLFFRYIPPNEYTFVHELIHLCQKPQDIYEETYAYNLAHAVVFMAENNIKANPFKLFKLTKEQILEVLREFNISSFEEFYQLAGVIPYIYSIDEDGNLKLEDERSEVVIFIIELVSGLRYVPWFRKIFTKLVSLANSS